MIFREFRGIDLANTVRPFLTSKEFLHNDNISININGNIVQDEEKLTKEFNLY